MSEANINLDPLPSDVMALSLVLAAAFMWGTWFISLKHLGAYPIDAFVITMLLASAALAWTVGIVLQGRVLLTNLVDTFVSDPCRVSVVLLCGGVYVVGMRVGLAVQQAIGLSSAQPVTSSFGILASTMISGIVGGLPSGISLVKLAVACLCLVAAVWAGMHSIQLRDRNRQRMASRADALRLTSLAARRVLALAFLSAILWSAYPLALSYGLATISHGEGFDAICLMVLLSSGALLGSMCTSGVFLAISDQWPAVSKAPITLHKWGLLSGLLHGGGNLLNAIASMALSTVISYPLGLTSGLWTQAWGLAYGEYRGAGRRAHLSLLLAVALYVVGALVIATSA